MAQSLAQAAAPAQPLQPVRHLEVDGAGRLRDHRGGEPNSLAKRDDLTHIMVTPESRAPPIDAPEPEE